MEGQILRPSKEEVILEGRLAYSESLRAWNTIRLKKGILDEFKQLRDRMTKFAYKMIFYSEWNELEKALRKNRKEGLPVPVLIWFVKEKN
jgi:hypothetical protein